MSGVCMRHRVIRWASLADNGDRPDVGSAGASRPFATDYQLLDAGAERFDGAPISDGSDRSLHAAER
jgi:hypothetical protein